MSYMCIVFHCTIIVMALGTVDLDDRMVLSLCSTTSAIFLVLLVNELLD